MKAYLLITLSIVSLSYACHVKKQSCGQMVFEYVSTEQEIIDTLLNSWHQDVIDFNLESYFNLMDESFIFLGTDPKERWTKQAFYKFCKPFFEKKSTWRFKPLWRNVYFSEDGKTAWFEEQLDTWMEECRGSGVLVLKNNEWKIVHYNLTVLIENEKVKSFIELRKL